MDINFLEFMIENAFSAKSSIHGPKHWEDVLLNGLYLSNFTDADVEIVKYFSCLHDSQRVDDFNDFGHGLRASDFARNHREKFDLTDDQFEVLLKACAEHTDGFHTDCPTIGTCWDSDRLDLIRVGFKIDSKFLHSQEAKRIADNEDFDDLNKFKQRMVESLYDN